MPEIRTKPSSNDIDELEAIGLFACTVVSLVPFALTESKPGLVPGYYAIPASDTITPQVIHVHEAKHYVYLDSGRGSLPVINSPERVANSIVKDYVNGQLAVKTDARPAIFFVPGTWTPEQILDKFGTRCKLHLNLQKNWFMAIVKLADDDWKRYGKHNVISDNQRTAANLLGLRASDHPWLMMDQVANAVKCKACFQNIEPNQVICHVCKAIQHPELAAGIKFAQ